MDDNASEPQALAGSGSHSGQSRPPIQLKVVQGKDGIQVVLDYTDPAAGQAHLMAALGTSDRTFAISILNDLANLAKRKKDLTEEELNNLLSIVRGIAPRDPIEALLAVQMAAIHSATITAARTLRHIETIQQQDSASTSLNKLARTFAAQVEALKRHRSTGEQNVNVKHVHVHAGGQAVVGNVATRGAGDGKNERQSHGPDGEVARSTKMLSHIEADRATMPVAGRAGQERVPISRSTRRGT
jgi:hypothetical protein